MNRNNATGFRLIPLRNGTLGVFSEEFGEAMHPTIGPAQEAEALYVRQLRLRERVPAAADEFVVWDVGLGGAANASAVLRAAADAGGNLRLVSFECSVEAPAFALAHAAELGYLGGLETPLRELLEGRATHFHFGRANVSWELVIADFPSWLAAVESPAGVPPPHAILFDPFSPARNPAMWSLEVFTRLFRRLDPARPCSLATYSRSTMTRVAMLLAGFWVGAGAASGVKEETTLAANSPALLPNLLDARWLAKARRSHNAEPLAAGSQERRPLSAESWERLLAHPQFATAATG